MTQTLKALKESNLFTLLNTKPRIQVEVDYPQYDDDGNSIGKVIIRLLTHDEHIEIQGEAVAETERLFAKEGTKIERESAYYKARHDNVCAKFFLWRALRDPENPNMALFPTPDQVGRFLSNNQVETLSMVYRQLEDYGPKLATMTLDDFNRWTEKLATAAEGDFGSFLGRILPVAQIHLLLHLAKENTRLKNKLSQLEMENTNLQTDNFSVTMQQESSTSELENDKPSQ